MAELDVEIAAYEAQHEELETHHLHKWVLFHEEEFCGAFDDFNAAASEAVRRFGRGPYLIRQVGAHPPVLPASILFRPKHAVG